MSQFPNFIQQSNNNDINKNNVIAYKILERYYSTFTYVLGMTENFFGSIYSFSTLSIRRNATFYKKLIFQNYIIQCIQW